MKIRIAKPVLVPDLVAYLRRCSCDAVAREDGSVEARVTAPVPPAWGEMEIAAFVRTWTALHPGAEPVTLVTSPPPARAVARAGARQSGAR